MSLLTNLVAYYNFQGNSNDISGGGFTNADTAITYNTSNGIVGQGAGFNGTTSQMLGSAQIIPLGAKTISFWSKNTLHPAFAAVLGNNLVSSTNHGTEIFVTAGGGTTYQFFIGMGSGNIFSLTSPSYTAGVWNFFTCTWDGTTSANAVKFYVNAGTPTTATASQTETVAAGISMRIGSIGGANYFNGALDEIGIWSRVLTAAEVTQLYGNGLGLTYPFTKSTLMFFKLMK